jgi:toxin ParE1/3/4
MPSGSADRYALTPSARRDLASIWRYSAERWSPRQADCYVAALAEGFIAAARRPAGAALRPELGSGVQLRRVRSHLILYQESDFGVTILRVRHQREDWLQPVADDDDASGG